MLKLYGHWVAKRTDILEHYKGMTLSEIVLFDAYLLLADKQTWECWKTVRQLAEILPMKKDSIVRAKKRLLDNGWIIKVNRTGIYIPKLYRYADEGTAKDQSVSEDKIGLSHSGEGTSLDDKKSLSHLREQTFPHTRNLSRLGEQSVSFGGTSIEEYIIEDIKILSKHTDADLRGWIKNSVKQKEKKNAGQSIHGNRSNSNRIRSGRKGIDLPSDYPIDIGFVNFGKA